MFLFRFQDDLSSGQNCRVMQFHSPTINHSLARHAIGNVWVTSEIACESACFAEDDCMSVNFGPQNQDGKHLCELSESDHEISPQDLRQRAGFLYKAVEVRWARQSIQVTKLRVQGYGNRRDAPKAATKYVEYLLVVSCLPLCLPKSVKYGDTSCICTHLMRRIL